MNAKINAVISSLCTSVVLLACTPAVYTVGGTIPSINGGIGDAKAQFSLYGDFCKLTSPAGTFTYQDKSFLNPDGKGAGLQATGSVIFTSDCSNPTEAFIPGLNARENEFCAQALADCGAVGSNAPIQFFVAQYYSMNKKLPGEGVILGCVQDNGQGNDGLKDIATINVPATGGTNGPYEGYLNTGEVQGNIQTHTCPPNS